MSSHFRDELAAEYERFSRSFTRIRAEDISRQVDAAYAARRFWPGAAHPAEPELRAGRMAPHLEGRRRARRSAGDHGPVHGQVPEREVLARHPVLRRVPDMREDNNPRIHFPDGFNRDGCKVDVWVGKWSDHSRAGWDLAHECVHLLDPIMEKYATYLEEGLATWYQDSPQLHPDYQNIRSLVQGHINGHPEGMRHKDPKYRGAKELVQKCMPEIKSAVRSIRKKGAKQPMCGIVRSRP